MTKKAENPFSKEIVKITKNTLSEALGIEMARMEPDYVEARMPVDKRTRQPMGLLHGGASAALAETLASIGANLSVDSQQSYVVGVELNANHLRSAKDGWVKGIAKPLHRGKKIQVWNIEIFDDQERLICISRCTLAVLDRR